MLPPKEPVGPFIRKWDGHDRTHFYSWARATYSQDSYDSHPYRKNRRNRHHKWHLAYRLFRVGKANYVLEQSMAEFWAWIEPVEKHYSYTYPDRKLPHGSHYNREKRSWVDVDYRDWYPKNGAHYRCKIPLRITEKKTLSEQEQQKRAWREKKGFNRSRKGKSNPGKRWSKTACNRSFRSFEKQLLDHEKWDDFFKVRPKHFFDPWDFN